MNDRKWKVKAQGEGAMKLLLWKHENPFMEKALQLEPCVIICMSSFIIYDQFLTKNKVTLRCNEYKLTWML
jgi:hypothetical protein